MQRDHATSLEQNIRLVLLIARKKGIPNTLSQQITEIQNFHLCTIVGQRSRIENLTIFMLVEVRRPRTNTTGVLYFPCHCHGRTCTVIISTKWVIGVLMQQSKLVLKIKTRQSNKKDAKLNVKHKKLGFTWISKNLPTSTGLAPCLLLETIQYRTRTISFRFNLNLSPLYALLYLSLSNL